MSWLGQHPPFQQLKNSPIGLCKEPCLPEPRAVFSEDGGCARKAGWALHTHNTLKLWKIIQTPFFFLKLN